MYLHSLHVKLPHRNNQIYNFVGLKDIIDVQNP